MGQLPTSIHVCITGNNLISNNFATNLNTNGIYLYFENNDIVANNMVNSNVYTQTGINVLYSHNNTLINNTANSNGYGISNGGNDNVFINNTLNSNQFAGIILHTPYYNSTLINNTANWNYIGFELSGHKYSNITGSTALHNSYGFFLSSTSDNNSIVDSIIHSGKYGFDLYNAHNNTLSGNNITNNSYCCGILLDYLSNGNVIYNNYFNNKINFNIETGSNNIWNTTKRSGKNIVGGPYIGGNFWANQSNNDFSQTCADIDSNGICDLQYNIKGSNIDYLSLSMNFALHEIGDIDNDGLITAADALLYLRYAVHQNIAPFHMDESDDVTCDENIFADDALLVLRKAVNQPVDLICQKP